MTTTQSLQQLADQCFQQGQPVTTFMRSIYMHEEYAYEREGNDFYYHSQCVNMVSVLSLLGYTVTPFGVAKAQ